MALISHPSPYLLIQSWVSANASAPSQLAVCFSMISTPGWSARYSVRPCSTQDLCRGTERTENQADLGLLADRVDEHLALSPAELDVIGADERDHFSRIADAVVGREDRDAGLVGLQDHRHDALDVTGGDDDGVLALGDELLDNGYLGGEVAVPVLQIKVDAVAAGGIFLPLDEVGIEADGRVPDHRADLDRLPHRRRTGFLVLRERGAAQRQRQDGRQAECGPSTQGPVIPRQCNSSLPLPLHGVDADRGEDDHAGDCRLPVRRHTE